MHRDRKTEAPRRPGYQFLFRNRLAALAMAAAALAPILSMAGDAAAADVRTKCDVAFSVGALPEGTRVGLLDFTVQYVRPKVFPPDPQGQIRCTGLDPGSAAAATNMTSGPSAGTLTVAFASEDGIGANTPAVRCDVYVAGIAEASDFPVLTTLQARDVAGVPIDPLPVLSVTAIRCGDQVTTTTTTTTTVTLTTTTTDAPSSTTTTTLEPETCSVRLRLTSSGDYRRLRLNVDYSASGGEPALPVRLACRGLAGGIGVGAQLDAAAQLLELDVVSVLPMHGPLNFVACDFVPVDAIGTSADFKTNVLLAADATGAPSAVKPVVTVSDVMCPSLTTTTTTTTTTLPAAVCGDADNNGEVTAGDALAALRAAVGLASGCTLARCDVDSSGVIRASDALAILRFAVDPKTVLNCPM